MKKIAGAAVLVIITAVLILLAASLPSLLTLGRPSNIQYYSNVEDPDFKGSKLYKLHFHPENLWRKPVLYFRQLAAGKVFKFTEGKTVRSYLVEAPRYLRVSLLYISTAGILSLLAGTFVSLRMADKKNNPAFYEFLSFMSVFPDFILILLIQFAAFYLHKLSGFNPVRYYTASSSDRAVLLPVLVMTIYPTLHIIRTIGGQLREVNSESYIRYAHAKGLSPGFIRYFHIGPAAVRFLKGDINKVLTILFANLFITELLFNNKGITAFLFYNISEYAATVNTIILMMLLYLAVYLLLNLVLTLMGIILRRSRP